MDDLDRLLSETRRALVQMWSDGAPSATASDGPSSATASDGPPSATDAVPSGRGTAMDGQITAVAAAGGRIESLEMNPRLMRMGSKNLCAGIMEAVNAALADLRSQSTAAVAPGDPAVLDGQLAEVQAEAVRQMQKFSSGIAETIAQIQSAAGVRRG